MACRRTFDPSKATEVRVHTQDPPPEVADFVTQYGGKDLFGQSRFRIVWGGCRNKGTRMVRQNRWVMERLRSFDGLDRGSYQFVGTFTDVDGEGFIQPDIGMSKFLIDLTRRLLETSREEFEAKRPDEKEEEEKSVQDLYLRIKDATPRSLHNPTIFQPGTIAF